MILHSRDDAVVKLRGRYRKTITGGRCNHGVGGELNDMNGLTVKVILNPEKEDELRILDYLEYCGEPKSKAIKGAVLSFLDARSNTPEDYLLREVRKIVHEELKIVQLQLGAPAFDAAEASDNNSILDFLDAMG